MPDSTSDSRGEYKFLVPKKKEYVPIENNGLKKETEQLRSRTKALKAYQKASRAAPIPKISLRPIQQQISREQDMLGQLFGHGDKFFGSKKMLPFAGTPDEEGSETWKAFGI